MWRVTITFAGNRLKIFQLFLQFKTQTPITSIQDNTSSLH